MNEFIAVSTTDLQILSEISQGVAKMNIFDIAYREGCEGHTILFRDNARPPSRQNCAPRPRMEASSASVILATLCTKDKSNEICRLWQRR